MQYTHILIADSGSTKTDWCIMQAGKDPVQLQTPGINPFFQSKEEIETSLLTHLIPQLPPASWQAVYFYGAGCTAEKAPSLVKILNQTFPSLEVAEAHSDMLGAARALCGRKAGICCILGTGSNSCFYNGESITSQVSPLGFILGDEGSGAVLGKRLIADVLKKQLPTHCRDMFWQTYSLTPAEIIEQVYRKPFPNRFLASFTPFIATHIEEPALHQLVLDCFIAFIRRNVQQYDYHSYPVHFTGSIAYHFQSVLQEAAAQTGIQIGTVLSSPLNGLINYYL